MAQNRLGIIVGGGPAPGINAVIGAATIEAINRGFEVVGFYDGFQWLASKSFDMDQHAVRLTIPQVARIHFHGGSMLRTSRTSLINKQSKAEGRVEPDPMKIQNVQDNLKCFGINCLLTIGGDDTALSARLVSESVDGSIRIVHCPKTIDNDLPLPNDVPTFGFSTARFIGTSLVKNLMQDSQTTGRWYLTEAMGRSAGWLAMAIGTAAGATLTLIPEEFPFPTKFATVLDVIEGAILKRRAMGRPDGVALMAEGLAYKLGDHAELEALTGKKIPLDAAGHPRLSEVNLTFLLQDALEKRFEARGQSCKLVSVEIGYELRSADPTPFDMGYCRMLGYFAIQLLREGKTKHAMVALVNGDLQPIDLTEMIDPETNRTRVRRVSTSADEYRVARAYQIRLEPSDFADDDKLAKLAHEARMSPDEFRAKFEHVAKIPDGWCGNC